MKTRHRRLTVAYWHQGSRALFVITSQTHRLNEFNGDSSTFRHVDGNGTEWDLVSEDYPDGSVVHSERKLYVRGPQEHRDKDLLSCPWTDFQRFIPVILKYNQIWNQNKKICSESLVVDVTNQWNKMKEET